MNNVIIEQRRSPVEQERHAIEEVGGGSIVESIGGIGALVLSILGLIGFMPVTMASIASIAAGGALLIGGGTLASQYKRIFSGARPRLSHSVIGGGMAMESLAGFAGIVLGILALLGIHQLVMLGASVIVLGCALLLASGAITRLTSLPIRGPFGAAEQAREAEFERYHEQYMARDALYAASGSEALIGAGSIVLGILSLSGIAPLALILVALLAIGASILLAGSSVAGRMFESIAAH
ncbi:MAG TPA: hypothetical protein VFY40_27070 [Blastocatellia bacterium]|nr:hypothetical protein [Blastocatellia bacterium]